MDHEHVFVQQHTYNCDGCAFVYVCTKQSCEQTATQHGTGNQFVLQNQL